MDFFSSQDQARRRTSWLVLYFLMAVFCISLALYAVVLLVWNVFLAEPPDAAAVEAGGAVLWDPVIFLITFGGSILLIGSGTFFESLRLGRVGGAGVAEKLGGQRIPPNTTDPEYRRLLNVVEEMALASGVPIPPVYVLENEDSINAFAAGFKPSDAVLGFTHGAIRRLNREELQAVVAHEFSHVLNGDMRLNLKLMGTVQGIILISVIGASMLRVLPFMGSGSGRSRGGGSRGGGRGSGGGNALPLLVAILLISLAMTVIGYIGVFFGRLIKSAVSRQREFLADAAAVQFTRNPQGLAGALKKIGGMGKFSRIQSAYAEQASHMFIGAPGYKALSGGILATHPPLSTRIRRLDPTFDGKFPAIERKRKYDASAVSSIAEDGRTANAQRAAQNADAFPSLKPEAIMQSIGAPMREHVQLARSMMAAMALSTREAVHEPYGARAVIYALLLDDDETIRKQQWQVLEERADPGVFEETQRLAEEVRRTERNLRIALVDLAMPALKEISAQQYRVFRDNVNDLAAADEQISLFEFTLLHTLRHNLDAHFFRPQSRAPQIYSIVGLEAECSVLFSLMARLDMESEEQSREAFDRAVKRIAEPRANIRMLDPDVSSLEDVDHALEKMADASPRVKRQIIVACMECLVTNRKISAVESELFRAVAYALDVPIPPWAKAA